MKAYNDLAVKRHLRPTIYYSFKLGNIIAAITKNHKCTRFFIASGLHPPAAPPEAVQYSATYNCTQDMKKSTCR